VREGGSEGERERGREERRERERGRERGRDGSLLRLRLLMCRHSHSIRLLRPKMAGLLLLIWYYSGYFFPPDVMQQIQTRATTSTR